MEHLIVDGAATYKWPVTLKLRDGSTQDCLRSVWLCESPFNVELRTMHVARPRLIDAIRDIAYELEA
jgi:hypothetical protein